MSEKPKIIIGLIHANWCGHCQALKPVWQEMKQDLNDDFDIQEIEDSDKNKEEKKSKLNEKIKGGKEIQANGFPTIFKIVDGEIQYFEGDRTKEKLVSWAKGGNMTGGKKSKKRKTTKRKSNKRKSRKNKKH
jgi:thiol-disulfide isomerase/thioredoxin